MLIQTLNSILSESDYELYNKEEYSFWEYTIILFLCSIVLIFYFINKVNDINKNYSYWCCPHHLWENGSEVIPSFKRYRLSSKVTRASFRELNVFI